MVFIMMMTMMTTTMIITMSWIITVTTSSWPLRGRWAPVRLSDILIFYHRNVNSISIV